MESRCSYCKKKGHNISICPDVESKISELSTKVNKYMEKYRNNVDERTITLTDVDFSNLFHHFTLFDLKMIYRSNGVPVMNNFIIFLNGNGDKWDNPSKWIKSDYVLFLNTFYKYKLGIWKSKNKFNIIVSEIEIQTEKETFDCPICIETNIPNIELVKTNCNHDVCKKCFNKYLSNLKLDVKPCCCLCRTEITAIQYVKKLI
jgi:hypothetical protein